MNNMPQLSTLARLCALLVACQLSSVQAVEPVPVEVKPNDTLSGIVLFNYPGYGNRQAAMQVILERNPDAFIDNDINRLIVGKVLQLPDIDTLPAAAPGDQPSAPIEAPANINSANQETLLKLESISQERDRLSTALKALEKENESLQTKISELENLKSKQDEQLDLLGEKIKVLEAAAIAQSGSDSATAASLEQIKQLEATNTGLQNASDTLTTENAALQEELSSVREQLNASTKETETLRKNLDVLNQKNEELTGTLDTLNLQNTELQGALDTANQQNTTLQNDISQIRASATNDVNLLQEKQTLQTQNPLWPWLLALFLLPIAWLLGRRSRPTPEQHDVITTDLTDEAYTAPDLSNEANDPVIPTALPGELDDVASLNTPVIPDNPDTAIKLDMARAYLDLRDSEAANDMLREVIREGGTQQQHEAREILSFIS